MEANCHLNWEDELVNNMCNLIFKVNSIKINEKSKLITKGFDISGQVIPKIESIRGQIIVA